MKAFKHMTALVLALVMAAALAVTAYAASVTVKYRVYVYSDEITFRQYDYSQSTTPSITNLTISATSGLGSGSALYHMKYADGAVAYCIEPGVHSDDSGTYKEGSSASWYNLPASVQSGIALALACGYPSAEYKIKAVEEQGSITVRKVDATGSPLAGAELLLETSADGKTWTEVGKITTDSTGVAKWENLKTGVQYRVTETKSPAGYTLLTEPLFAGVGQQADDHIDPDLRLGFGKFRVGCVLVILLQRLQVLPLDVVDLDGRIPVDQVADYDVELFQRHRIEVCPLFQRLPLHGRGDDGTHGGNDDDHGQIK